MKNIMKYASILTFLLVTSTATKAATERFSSEDIIEAKKAPKFEVKYTPLKINIPDIKNFKPETVEDKVKIKSSGTKKGTKKKDDFEMVFFDYGKGKPKKKAKQKRPESLEKILKNFKMPKEPKFRKQKNIPGAIDYAKLLNQAYGDNKSEQAFKLNVTRIDTDGSFKVTDFDIIPYHNPNDILSDNGSGSVGIYTSSKGHGYSTYRGTILSRGLVRANFELAIQQETMVAVPVLSEQLLENILEKYDIRERYGSYLLIDLGDDLDSTRVEGKFQKKIFFNEKFREVEAGSKYRYEFYLDIEPGNHLVEYMDLKGKIAQKILFIAPEEMTYDEPILERESYDFVELYEENVVSKKLGPLNVENAKVRFFNSKARAKKEGLNRYKVRVPLRDLAFRKYLELGNESIIYVGYDKNKKIVVPSRDYVSYIKQAFDMYEDSRNCIIQFNLSKSAKSFEAYVNSHRPAGNFNIYYMDKDGSLSEELTGLTDRVFVVSHDYGVVNAKYTTGKKVTFTQSFCSDSLYLIEQL